MRQWMKKRGMLLALALLLAAGTPLYMVQTPVQVSAKAVKKGLKREKGKYYYYKKGVKVKKQWVSIGKKKYYFQKNGAAAVDWNKIGNKAYYFNSKGVMAKNKRVDGVKLNAKGQASLNNDRVKLIFAVKSVMAKKTKSSQSKAQKLKACYNDMLKCGYAGKFGSTTVSGWEVKYAYDMLTSRKGNCYSYASAFAMLARECGYNAKIVTGKITKDGGNEIPHAWVEISGKVYDPQTQQNMGIDLYGKKYTDMSRVVYMAEKKI